MSVLAGKRTHMKLSDLFTEENVVIDLEPMDKEGLLRTIVADLEAKGCIKDAEQAAQDLVEREKVMSTGIGHGVAIPHAYTDGVDRLVAGFYRTKSPVGFDALDDQEVNLFFVILGPKESRRDHIKVLAKISRLLNHLEFRQDLVTAGDGAAVMSVLRRFGDR